MSYVTNKWVMPHLMSHVSYSPHPILPIWMSHAAYEWVMSLTKESCLIWWVISHTAPTPSSPSPAADAALLNRGGGWGWGESWNLLNFPRISANNFRVLPQPKIWPPPQSEMEVLYTHMCVCVCVCTYGYRHMYVDTYMFVNFSYRYICIYICTCICMCICI